mmetsp:Transcript_6125/g.10577  ORF Transcript_6125/g.10577 Transcript_6125/m.10577 type:complete len:126 (+) Transcript_6125:1115-1492(+)
MANVPYDCQCSCWCRSSYFELWSSGMNSPNSPTHPIQQQKPNVWTDSKFFSAVHVKRKLIGFFALPHFDISRVSFSCTYQVQLHHNVLQDLLNSFLTKTKTKGKPKLLLSSKLQNHQDLTTIPLI